MNNKFTPGPWKHEGPYHIYGVTQDGNAERDYVPVHPLVATVAERTGEREANARLIAAAPELLKALREMVKDGEANGESEAYCYFCATSAPVDDDGEALAEIVHCSDCPLQMARDAIAKAVAEQI